MEQTAPLAENKARVPIVALGGEREQGDRVRQMVALVAENVSGGTLPDCGHFLPEERPDEIARQILEITSRRERR